MTERRRASFEVQTGPDLARDGRWVGRTNEGRVVFVERGAPHERVRVEVTSERKGSLEGRITKVLEPSPDRVDPKCPHYERCGGCSLQHVAYPAQLRAKQRHFESSLARLGGVQVSCDPPWASEPFGFRSRARLHGLDGAIGFFARNAHRVVDVSTCPVLTPPLEHALEVARKTFRTGRGSFELELIEHAKGVLVGAPPALIRGGERIVDDVVLTNPDAAHAAKDDGFGPAFVSPGAFAQSAHAGNRALLEHLAVTIATIAKDAKVLELYAGSGNLTRLLGLERSLVAVEIDRRARSLFQLAFPSARVGSVTFEPGVSYVEASAEDALATLREIPDAVILDPPREGLSKTARDQLARLGAPKIVMVSCDVATSARDVKALSEKGYRVTNAKLFDFYPQTDHAEAVLILER